MTARAVISVDVYRFAGAIKGAAIERHGRRAVRPKGVIALGRVERRVRKLGGLIAPVERLTVDNTAVEHGLIGTNETKIVGTAGTHRHVLEGYGAGAVKGIVAVVLGAEMSWIGHKRADVPRGLVGAGTHERQIFALGMTLGGHLVEGIVALTEQDGVAALRLCGCGGDIGVGRLCAIVGDTWCVSVRYCRHEASSDKRDQQCYKRDPPPQDAFSAVLIPACTINSFQQCYPSARTPLKTSCAR